MSVVYKKLEEVCEILDSQRIPITAKDRKVGQYPYYGANGLQDYVAEYIFDDELVLLAEDGGNFGSTDRPIAYRVSGKCWVNNHAHVLKAKPCIDIDYLGYSLMFYDTSGLVNGATRQKLTQAAMREMKIPYRNSDEQKEIVRKIDGVFSLIEKSHLELHHLDQLVKSRFVEMFGAPITNKMGWPCLSLVKTCKAILGGGTPSKSHPEYFTGGIPWVSPKDMKYAVISDSIDHITEEAVAHSTTNLVPKNSVLMVIRSGILKHTLPVAINSVPVTINQDMKAFVPGNGVITEFLMYYFKAIESDVLAGVRGVTADNIDFKAFQQRTIIVPPLELQNRFAAFVTEVDKSKFSIQKSLSTSRKLWTLARIDAIMNMDFSTQRSL